jgi:hypothetical protein
MFNFGRGTAGVRTAMLLAVAALALAGARAEEPARPKPTGYPAVEDVPPRPEKPAMTAEEQSKLRKELNAARDRQPKSPGGGNSARPHPNGG